MERKSELTKALLGEKFKELVAKKGFEKLTIKMITDAAGVIRPTFYNYFQDKYEVMEWLLWEDVFKEVSEAYGAGTCNGVSASFCSRDLEKTRLITKRYLK